MNIHCEACGAVTTCANWPELPKGWETSTALDPESGEATLYFCPECVEGLTEQMDAMRWANGW